MNINMKYILKGVFLILIILTTGTILFRIEKKYSSKEDNKKLISAGLTKNQGEYFKEQINQTGTFFGYYKKGYALLNNGKKDEAISMFKNALTNAYSQGTIAEAYRGLTDAYEKKRAYATALKYQIMIRDKYVNEWAEAPEIERAKYLEYASNGDYQSAVKYAKLALEVETNMPYNKGEPKSGYINRLNDIINAKGYILSLKKTE